MSASIDFAADAGEPPAVDPARIPDDPALRRVALGTRRLIQLDAALARAEALAERIRAERRTLATRVLPDLLDELGVDRVGVPTANLDLVVQTDYHASIKVDAPDRDASFAHLTALGGGDLIKATVVVAFAREDLPLARQFLHHANEWLRGVGRGTTRLDLGVHWATLTNWLRAELTTPRRAGDNRPPVDLARLGATVERVCRVAPRPDPTLKKRRSKRVS